MEDASSTGPSPSPPLTERAGKSGRPASKARRTLYPRGPRDRHDRCGFPRLLCPTRAQLGLTALGRLRPDTTPVRFIARVPDALRPTLATGPVPFTARSRSEARPWSTGSPPAQARGQARPVSREGGSGRWTAEGLAKPWSTDFTV